MATSGFVKQYSAAEVSVKLAFDLLFRPDDAMDIEDGLRMFDVLDARGQLDAPTRARLRQRLRERPPIFLAAARRLTWGSESPPSERFWWFEPQEWTAEQRAA